MIIQTPEIKREIDFKVARQVEHTLISNTKDYSHLVEDNNNTNNLLSNIIIKKITKIYHANSNTKDNKLNLLSNNNNNNNNIGSTSIKETGITINTKDINFNYKKLCIIITDDENLIRKSVIRVIDKYFTSLKINLELTIIEANDGIESIIAVYSAISQNIHVDLIISDETMKYVSGSMSADIVQTIN